ncbi:MAG: hypothetical protein LBQ60_21620, partial [Bacteroidales bacterium]|nr:hypothetical protein [Bacteroidales bacterium]
MIKYIFKVFCIFLFFFFMFSISLDAQDFLVTKSLDSLNCKIGKLENDQYYLTFYQNDKKTEGYIHKDSILFFKKNVFRSLHNNRLLPWYPLVDFSVDAGIAHQYGKFQIEDDLTDKSNFAARTGLYASAELTYYVTKLVGYGIKYNYRRLLDGDLSYHYVGPMIAFRFWNKNRKNYFFFNASAGFGSMIQKNAPIQLELIRPRIEMHANIFAGDLSAGYNLRLSPMVSMRLKLSGTFGKSNFI